MSKDIIRISSLTQLHDALGLPKPKHPLISLMDAGDFHVPREMVGTKVISDFYMISLKDKSCGMDYGRNTFDFQEGVMAFTAPGQVSGINEEVRPGDIKGWMLYFHPELIKGTHLAEAMDDFQFFNYEVYEALHLSESEEETVFECVKNIKAEYEQRIDNHSQRVIISSLELLLNYSRRFYERQFNTRTSQNIGVVAQFEKDLNTYFENDEQLKNGLPSIKHFSEKAHLSQHYFSDLLKKETGRTAKDHINDFVIEKAKNVLLGSDQNVSEIAYDLGFNYPHYFTRLFKTKTGMTPVEYRQLN